MSTGRICIREVYLADPDETVEAIAHRMHERGVGSLLVLDDARRPMGIVTDRDLVLRVLAADRDPLTTRVAEVMTRSPRTVSEETPIEQTLSLMRGYGIRRVPVVDREGKLAGVVTLDDILALLTEELTIVGEALSKQTPPRRLLEDLLETTPRRERA
ncbi:MAG: CBS domain-containing protein [Planctomycetes bacterium]|nr:CBS domain-containing protein [Planctomycetota bacterium]